MVQNKVRKQGGKGLRGGPDLVRACGESYPAIHSGKTAHTSRMRPYRLGVHPEERNGNKGAISSESEDGIPEFHCGMVLFSIALVEVDV